VLPLLGCGGYVIDVFNPMVESKPDGEALNPRFLASADVTCTKALPSTGLGELLLVGSVPREASAASWLVCVATS
jgi:hypothetical protein